MLTVIWYITTLILTKELVMADDDQCTDFQFKSPFLPGESCEGIYNKNPENHTKSGYYWILSREYCGMTYTGSSCEDIYSNNPETNDKSGYYRVTDKWTYCNMKEASSTTRIIPTTITVTSTTSYTTTKTILLPSVSPKAIVPTSLPTASSHTSDYLSTCAGMGGGWKRITKTDISAGDDCPSVSFCRVVSDELDACSSANFSTNGTSYQRVCGRARGYQKGGANSFYRYYNYAETMKQLMATMLMV